MNCPSARTMPNVTSRMRSLVRFSPAFLAALLLAVCPSLRMAQQPTEPPSSCWKSVTTCMVIDSHHRAFVSIVPQRPEITVNWKHFPTPPSPNGRTSATESYWIDFFPTGVAAGLDGTLYVGGTRKNGKTVIQQWKFEIPNPLPNEATAFDRVSIRTVFNKNVAGRRHVFTLHSLVGVNGVMATFDDSRDAWVYNDSSKSWTLSASPSAGSGLNVPALGTLAWNRFHSRAHKTLGAMYVYSDSDSGTTLVLFDSDKNGTLDSSNVYTPDSWQLAGLNSPSNYDPVH